MISLYPTLDDLIQKKRNTKMLRKKELLSEIGALRIRTDVLRTQIYDKVGREVFFEILRKLESRVRRLEENAAPKCDSCGHIIAEKPNV